MFNHLVTVHEGAWESGQRLRMSAERFGEMSGDEFQGITTADPESLKRLERIDSLLMYEDGVDHPYALQVRVGNIRDIRQDGFYLTFRFAEKGKIPRKTLWEQRHRLQIDEFAFSRTHWAVKDGSLPQDVMTHMVVTPQRYDVVLSFAGEDRSYVEQVAEALVARDVVVFYDKFEEAALWGKNLAEHFEQVYSKHARYCVMFISRHYADKVWTRHERRSALIRAMAENVEYVLPARFDDTEIPGLHSSIGYADLRAKTPQELSTLVLQKLGRA